MSDTANTIKPVGMEEPDDELGGLSEGEEGLGKKHGPSRPPRQALKKEITPKKKIVSNKNRPEGCPPCDEIKEPIDWIYIIKILVILMLATLIVALLIDVISGGRLGIITFWVDYIKSLIG